MCLCKVPGPAMSKTVGVGCGGWWMLWAAHLCPVTAAGSRDQLSACILETWAQCWPWVGHTACCWAPEVMRDQPVTNSTVCAAMDVVPKGAQTCSITSQLCRKAQGAQTWESDPLQNISVRLPSWVRWSFCHNFHPPGLRVWQTWDLWWDRAVHIARTSPSSYLSYHVLSPGPAVEVENSATLARPFWTHLLSTKLNFCCSITFSLFFSSNLKAPYEIWVHSDNATTFLNICIFNRRRVLVWQGLLSTAFSCISCCSFHFFAFSVPSGLFCCFACTQCQAVKSVIPYVVLVASSENCPDSNVLTILCINALSNWNSLLKTCLLNETLDWRWCGPVTLFRSTFPTFFITAFHQHPSQHNTELRLLFSSRHTHKI